MSNLLKGILSAVLLIALINACSTTETAIIESSGADSLFPSWYNPSGFETDSLAYHGYGEAISNDSTIAAANAVFQARSNFETHIAELLEDARLELSDAGNTVVKEPDFIVTLRNAHQKVQEEASKVNAKAVSKESYYRGFAQVNLTKEELESVLKSGFSGKNSYWNAFQSAELFKK